MALRVTVGFDLNELGSATLHFDAGGAKSATVSATTSIHGSFDLSSYTDTGEYTGFSAKLKTQMDAAGGGPYTVTYTPSLLSYKISRTGGSWTLTSSTNTLMRNILGTGATFPISSVDISGVHTIDLLPSITTTAVRPYYLISGQLGASGEDTDDYEPDGVVVVAESDEGDTYSTAPTAMAVMRDFTIPFETQAATFTRFAAAAVPWTWQHFFQHSRGKEPFIVSDDIEQTVYKLRAEGARFKPIRVIPDFSDHWHVRMQCYVLGRL